MARLRTVWFVWLVQVSDLMPRPDHVREWLALSRARRGRGGGGGGGARENQRNAMAPWIDQLIATPMLGGFEKFEVVVAYYPRLDCKHREAKDKSLRGSTLSQMPRR